MFNLLLVIDPFAFDTSSDLIPWFSYQPFRRPSVSGGVMPVNVLATPRL